MKLLRLFVVITNLFIHPNFSFAMFQASDDYEGWVWRKSLNFVLPNSKGAFVDADSIHQQMADLAEKFQPAVQVKSKEPSKESKEKKNIALIRLGFIIESQNGNYAYTQSPCFDDYVFYSGQTTHKVSSSEEELFQKAEFIKTPYLKRYVISEPLKYSFSLEDIIATQNRFFPKGEESTTGISKAKYQTQYFEDKLKEALRNENLEERSKKAGGIISDFEGTYSDSEKKVCFFIEDSLRDIPFYWNFRFLSLLKKLIPLLENRYITTFKNENELRRKMLEQEIKKETLALSSLPLDNSLRDKLTHIYSLTNEKKKLEQATQKIRVKKPPLETLKKEIEEITKEEEKGGEKKEELEKEDVKALESLEKEKKTEEVSSKESKLKKQPTKPSKEMEEKLSSTKEEERKEGLKDEDVKTLSLLIGEIEGLRKTNPLNVSQKALDEDNSDKHLSHVKNLLILQANNSWKESIDYVRQQILEREESYSFWIRSVWPFLNSLQQGYNIKGIIFNLYSRRDICDSCTVRLSRECECNTGFVIKLKSMVSSILVKEPPFFRILASCSELRYRERLKHIDSFSNKEGYLIPIVPFSGATEEEQKTIFFQKILKQ